MEAMKWVSVLDALPEHRQAVLIRYAPDNWLRPHTVAGGSKHDIWRWQAAIFLKGKTAEEVAASGWGSHADQQGNNKLPYTWEEFGPGSIFGQDVTHWAAISDPVPPV